MSAASTRTLLEQLREHMDGNEAASQAKYEKLEADMKARIQELERKNAEMSKELVEEKGRTRRAMHILSGVSFLSVCKGPEKTDKTPCNLVRHKPHTRTLQHQPYTWTVDR